jgi:hypothetical protein
MNWVADAKETNCKITENTNQQGLPPWDKNLVDDKSRDA